MEKVGYKHRGYGVFVYLGAQAHSTLQQLTEPRDQLSKHGHIKVLQTLSTGTQKTHPYRRPQWCLSCFVKLEPWGLYP